MRGYIDPEGLVMLSLMILCLFVLVSCQESLEDTSSLSLPVNDAAQIPAPEPEEAPELFVEDEVQETVDTTKTKSLDDLLAQLEEEEAPVFEAIAENESESVATTLPTTRKQACREAQLPATYEACLGGCTKQCGDIALVKCEDVELPGTDGQTFACMTCSCTS